MNGIQFIVRQMAAMPAPPANLHAHIIELSKTLSQGEVAYQARVSRTTVCNVLRAAKKKEAQAGRPNK